MIITHFYIDGHTSFYTWKQKHQSTNYSQLYCYQQNFKIRDHCSSNRIWFINVPFFFMMANIYNLSTILSKRT